MISKKPHLPQFSSVGSVVGCEIEGVANGCEVVGRTAATSAVDVLDHHRAIGSSIALPQFVSVGSVVGCEIEGVANGCKVGERTAATSADDILDHHRA